MDMHPAILQESHEIYSEISSGKVVVRTLGTLKELREDTVYWVDGTIIGVDRNREFCYLACRICGKKSRRGSWQKMVLALPNIYFHKHIQTSPGNSSKFPLTNIKTDSIFKMLICRYNVEIVVADESETTKMTMWNRATQKLLGEPAENVISQYGDTARVMPDDIAKKNLEKEGMFEVVVYSQRSYDDSFNVSRLTIDEEIKDACIMRDFPAAYESNSEDDSFQATMDCVEEQDRAKDN